MGDAKTLKVSISAAEKVRRNARNAALEEAAQLVLSERPGRSDNEKALLVSLAARLCVLKDKP